jgi:acyl dehydratase/CBS domain-containing protein
MSFPIRTADVMSSPVRTAGPETTAATVASLCSEDGIGSVVVVEDDAPVGIVTTADLVELLGSDTEPRDRPVGEFMSSPVVTIDADAPVDAAVERMREAGIARLAVVEGDELVGLVSTDDVVRYVPQVFHRHQLESPPSEAYRYRVREETAYERSDWEFECFCRADDAVSVGDRVTFSKTLAEDDVAAFADASGDTNRLHLDAAYAVETRFGRRIVHGTLVGGLVSAALARLPGLTIYLSQDLSFRSPVGIGERASAVCEIVETFGRNKYALTTDVFGEDGRQVVEGEAVVLVDDPPAAAAVEVEAIPSATASSGANTDTTR